jgi:imidazole glycerol-phosphate synthase subunit HisF
MLRSRIIPCLLIREKGLVKTRRFGDEKYVGDPLNAVRIFNEKEVDEIIILDIDASRIHAEPNYDLIRTLAAECRMPMCYGGGVSTVDQFERIVGLGVEKVAISMAAVKNPELVNQASARVGSQSVVAVLDIKKKRLGRNYEIYIQNGQVKTGLSPFTFAKELEQRGVGEIVLNSIDRDGEQKGYDLDLIGAMRSEVTVPLTSLGGAGGMEDLKGLIRAFGPIGAAAGSLFVFKGKYRAVLINYPTRQEKLNLMA